ncbi:MAG TPA: hypothetical protein VFU07_09705 [Candidatus Lumbricidophila sp.]|nr:hypothetical protein [Candidatus Lumbricidophila sp.]
MRPRVERAVADHGFGHGWVVVVNGNVYSTHDTWRSALDSARLVGWLPVMEPTA